LIQKSYKSVLRLHWDAFNFSNLKSALALMEKRQEPYDVFLLVHGIPNYLVASTGQGLISWKELSELSGQLQHARGLYLQACFGKSVVPEFLKAGFQSVVAFDKKIWNFFFPGHLLGNLAKYSGDFAKAFEMTADNFDRDFRMNTVEKIVVQQLLKQDPTAYLETTDIPEIYLP
jgi:hypothetical protein